MKTKQHVGRFFHHSLIEIALMWGWDFDAPQDEIEFIESSEEFSDTDNLAMYTLTSTKRSLTVKDAIELTKGNTTENALRFFDELHKDLLGKSPEILEQPDYAIFISMHSGSSDYFTVSMLQDIIKISPFSSEE